MSDLRLRIPSLNLLIYQSDIVSEWEFVMVDPSNSVEEPLTKNYSALTLKLENALRECQELGEKLAQVVDEKAVIAARFQELLKEKHDSWWSGDPEKFHNFMGYEIPIDLMLMTGGGPSSFAQISDFHILNLKKWIGLKSNHSVVEIGCGIGRDAIPLTKTLTDGKYIGIDIIGRSIEWCQQNIEPKNPNFKFYHFDVDDLLHNPTGSMRTLEINIPAEDSSVDRIFLFSVFTHLLRPEIEHYLREFSRILKPGGMVYATTFIYDDAILASARETALTPFNLRFEHEISPGCRINNVDQPLGAVAFTRSVWDEMVADSGLRYAGPILKGSWSGFYEQADDGQDVAVMTKD